MPAKKDKRPAVDPSAWVEGFIEEFCRNSPDNSMMNEGNEAAMGMPLVGFSNGDDPLYRRIKDLIGPFYLTPGEIFEREFPGTDPAPAKLTVISWILPQTEATKRDHRRETTYPSERWARSRLFGEAFNAKLRKHVVETLTASGIDAVAPVDSRSWSMGTSERYGIASSWSERHAAHVSGLGTFGLCDGLITPVGKAVRCGSAVARISVRPTVRPYRDHREYCLHFSHGKCGKCIERCPAGAVSTLGHDKEKCRKYLYEVALVHVRDRFGLDTYPCGLCQAAVPCESRIPAAGKRPGA
jgi:epoxyqueuosine reductase